MNYSNPFQYTTILYAAVTVAGLAILIYGWRNDRQKRAIAIGAALIYFSSVGRYLSTLTSGDVLFESIQFIVSAIILAIVYFACADNPTEDNGQESIPKHRESKDLSQT